MNDFVKKPIKRKTQILIKKTTPKPTIVKTSYPEGKVFFGFKPEPVVLPPIDTPTS